MQVQQCFQSSDTNSPCGLTILLIFRGFSKNQIRSLFFGISSPKNDAPFERKDKQKQSFLVVLERWQYPFPSRTRKSSSLTPMILLQSGKVGSCQAFLWKPFMREVFMKLTIRRQDNLDSNFSNHYKIDREIATTDWQDKKKCDTVDSLAAKRKRWWRTEIARKGD